jgi:hypothetical protein
MLLSNIFLGDSRNRFPGGSYTKIPYSLRVSPVYLQAESTSTPLALLDEWQLDDLSNVFGPWL